MSIRKRRDVFLIITDLHASYRNKNSRHDYLNEIDYVIDNLFKIIESYPYDNVYLIFLGDVVDNSYKDQAKAVYLNNLFVLLLNKVKGIYFTVGNHEMTYYRDNPFWTLFNTIESEELKKVMTKSWQPKGLLNLGHIVDRLEFGEVVFNFNHHPTRVLDAIPAKINIGFFHKDIVSKAIVEDMKINNELDIFEVKPTYVEKSNLLRGYQYCFFGHVHKIYGRWIYEDEQTQEKTLLCYLASLGRPNHTEVKNNFLERDIPAVIISDGKFQEIEHNFFNLLSREQSVKEEIIVHQQKLYENRKDMNYFKEYMQVTDDPIENIKSVLSVSKDAVSIFEDYLHSDFPEFERELKRKLEEIKWL